MTASRMNWFY
jgi:MFS family permease